MSLWNIPHTWAWVAAGEIANIVGGGTPSTSDQSNYSSNVNSGIPWLTPADLSGYQERYISHGKRNLTKKGLEKSSAVLMPKGAVLFSSRAPIGYCAIAGEEVSTNQGFKSLVLKGNILSEYIYYYFLSAKEYAESLASGSTFKELSGSRMKTVKIPLPPLNEQRRIAAKIEELQSRSKKAREALVEAENLLEQLRQSVLHAAFTGKLTAAWREKHGGSFDKWEEKVFSDIATVKSNLVDPKEFQKSPHIAPDNIEKGTGRLLSYNTIEQDGVLSSKHRFYAGQILYSKIRPYLSKLVIVDFDGLCSADMYPIETDLETKYLFYYMLSDKFLRETELSGSRSVLPKINKKELGRINVTVPSLAEQQEIVRILDSVLSIVKEQSEHLFALLEQLNCLDQSILAKAFRGELVPQDPNDEPASELLKRIKAEADKTPAKGRKRRS